MLISKTQFSVNIEQINQDLNTVLTNVSWPESPLGTDLVANQISLKHRPGHEDWLDGIGSLKNKEGKEFAKESDFSVWNANVPEYTKSVLDEFQKSNNIKFGRIRYMRLMGKTGLRVHMDFEHRYHLAIVTNRFSMFGYYYEEKELEVAKCYHIPADGHFYIVDTRLPHFVYNGSLEERIHLVCSLIEQ
jgi:hypothetical protein